MNTQTLPLSELPFPLLRRGTVCDIYEIEDQGFTRLLFLFTDRFQVGGVQSEDRIPGKGNVLTALNLFWPDYLSWHMTGLYTQVITGTADFYPKALKEFRDQLDGRSFLAKKLAMLPIEYMVRGYRDAKRLVKTEFRPLLAEAESSRSAYVDPERHPVVIAEWMHENGIQIKKKPEELVEEVTEKSLEVYSVASDYALTKGIIIADTMLRWGLDDQGDFVLAGNVLTPRTSSYFLSEDGHRPGGLEWEIWERISGFRCDHMMAVPPIPAEILDRTAARYQEALSRLKSPAA